MNTKNTKCAKQCKLIGDIGVPGGLIHPLGALGFAAQLTLQIRNSQFQLLIDKAGRF